MTQPIDIPKHVYKRKKTPESSPESFPYSARHLNIETDVLPKDFKELLPIITEHEMSTLLKNGWIRIHCGTSKDAFYYCDKLTTLGFQVWVD